MSNTLKIAPDLYTKPPKTAESGARWDYRSIALATTDMITTQIVALGVLPAGHRLMDYFLESDDIDEATSAAITVGILNTYYGEAEASATNAAAYNSGGATNTDTEPKLVTGQDLVTASDVGQAGGRAAFHGRHRSRLFQRPHRGLAVLHRTGDPGSGYRRTWPVH